MNKLLKILLLASSFFIVKSSFTQCVTGDCENGFGKFVYKNGDWVEGYWKNKKLVPNKAGESKCAYSNLKNSKQKIEEYYDQVKEIINSKIPFDTNQILALKKEAEESYCVFKNTLDDKLIKKYSFLLNLFPKNELFEFNFTLFQSRNFSIYEKISNENNEKIFAILKTDVPFEAIDIRLPNSFFKIGFGSDRYLPGVYKQNVENPEFLIYHDFNTIYQQHVYYVVSRVELNKTNLNLRGEWGNQFKEFNLNFDKNRTLVIFDVLFRETEENLKLNLSKCDSKKEIQIFLKKYGHYLISDAVEKAKETYEAMLFAEIQNSKNVDDCKTFLTMFPNSVHVKEVNSKIEFLEKAHENFIEKNDKTVSFYVSIIKNFPNTKESDLAIESLVNYFAESILFDNVQSYIDTVDFVHSNISSFLNELQIKDFKKKYTQGLKLVSLNGYKSRNSVSQRINKISENWISYIGCSQKEWIDKDELRSVDQMLHDSIISAVLDDYFLRLTKCKSKEEQDRLLVEGLTNFPDINLLGNDLLGDSKSEFLYSILNHDYNFVEGDLTIYDSSYLYHWEETTGEFDVLKNLCFWISLPGSNYCEDLAKVNMEKLHFKNGHFSGKQQLYINNELFCEMFFIEGSMYNNVSEINLFSKNQKISTRYFDWPEIGRRNFTCYVYEFQNGVNTTLKELDKKIQEGISLANSKNYNAAIQHFEELRNNNFPSDLKQNILLDDKIKTLTELLGDSIKWIINDYDFALEKSFNVGKPLFIYFTDNGWQSKDLDKLLINTKQFNEWSDSNVVLLKLIYPSGSQKNPKAVEMKNEEIKQNYSKRGSPIYGYPTILVVKPLQSGEPNVYLESGLVSGWEKPEDWIQDFEEKMTSATKKTEMAVTKLNGSHTSTATSNSQQVNNSQVEPNKPTTNQDIPVYDISNRKQNNGNAKRIYTKSEIECIDDNDESTFNEKICKVKATGELLNGVVEEIDKNEYRTLKSRNEYKNGKLDGLSQYWKNDQLIKESNHLNGWHFGEYKEWHDNGQLKIIQKRNEYHCLIDDWFEWYSNGIMKFEAHFFDEQKNSLNTVQSTYGIGNGILKGSYREWHSSGKKAVEGQYDDSGTGIQVGSWNYWHSNGRIAKIIEYQYGVNWKERRFKEDGAEIFPPFKE